MDSAPERARQPRPSVVVAVVGTGTEVGKTFVSVALLSNLRSNYGLVVQARKPAQSFDSGDAIGTTDADLLAMATDETAHDVCPEHRWYPRALAPPMAAEVLGLPGPTLDDLTTELRWDLAPPADDSAATTNDRVGVAVGLVETAGGIRSPQATDLDGDAVGLLNRLQPELVLSVAPAGLGTINSVRLSLAPLMAWPVVVFLNRFDPTDDLHRRNRDVLELDASRPDSGNVTIAGSLDELTSITLSLLH